MRDVTNADEPSGPERRTTGPRAAPRHLTDEADATNLAHRRLRPLFGCAAEQIFHIV